MLPKSEPNDGQEFIHKVLEESKAKRDAINDDSLRNSFKNGILPFYHMRFSLSISYYDLIWTEEIPLTSPTVLAWCSFQTNKITIVDLEAKQEFVSFYGVRLRKIGSIF